MGFLAGNRLFEMIWFSDISSRDGAGWELWECTGEERILLIEIFRHDDLRKTDFATFGSTDIPLEAVEELLNTFNAEDSRNFIDEPDWS